MLCQIWKLDAEDYIRISAGEIDVHDRVIALTCHLANSNNL